MDVCSGDVRAGSPGLHGGRDERSGSLPGVWPAPGHGAQDAGLLGYRQAIDARTHPADPSLDPFTGVIDAILEADRQVPRKQRHTAKRDL